MDWTNGLRFGIVLDGCTFDVVNLPISAPETVVLSASVLGQGTLGHAKKYICINE